MPQVSEIVVKKTTKRTTYTLGEIETAILDGLDYPEDINVKFEWDVRQGSIANVILVTVEETTEEKVDGGIS